MAMGTIHRMNRSPKLVLFCTLPEFGPRRGPPLQGVLIQIGAWVTMKLRDSNPAAKKLLRVFSTYTGLYGAVLNLKPYTPTRFKP